MGKVLAVCISEKRGTEKKQIPAGDFKENWGIAEDAHAGRWHRQVSLLSAGKIEEFNKLGAQVDYGEFGENLVVEGIDFSALPVGARLRCNQVVLEITQIGKECHSHCNIYNRMGDCIMPREGVFAAVISGGRIAPGDNMEIIPYEEKRPFQAAVITLSDKGFRGERVDKSGPAIEDRLKKEGYEIIERLLLPDDEEALKSQLIRLCDQRQPDLILTTGGTGFSQRDITPEATMAVAHRNAPGIAEAIRAYSMKITSRAMLSRGVSVIRGRTLIINLPGSLKAVEESMDSFLNVIPHGIELLREEAHDCGEKGKN